MTARRGHHGGVFHRRLATPAPGQPTHHRRLPGHVPTAARLRRRGDRQAAVRLGLRRPRRTGHHAFLDHLEHDRDNSIRTRNARLAAIHSLFRYAALRHPEHAAQIERVLAIPPKRANQTIITFLTDDEVERPAGRAGPVHPPGRRDHAGSCSRSRPGCGSPSSSACRVGRAARRRRHVVCHGKGRKDRSPRSPPAPSTAAGLARRTRRATHRPAVSDQPRRATQSRRPGAAHRRTPPKPPACPSLGAKNHHPARPASHRGNAVAARRDRHHRHRPLARPRNSRDDADLRARRHGAQGTGPRPDHPTATPPGRYQPPDQLLAFLEAL